jgi:hypothetical protein
MACNELKFITHCHLVKIKSQGILHLQGFQTPLKLIIGGLKMTLNYFIIKKSEHTKPPKPL